MAAAAAAGRRLVTLGGKGSSLTPSSMFEVADGLARVAIDSSALSRRSSSSTSKSDAKFRFSIPDYFTRKEARASVILLLNKLLLSSSASACPQVVEILEQNDLGSDYTLSNVASDDLLLLDYSAAAIAGVSAILDHRSAALASIVDAVAALSCEALRADVTPFNLMDSGDGSSSKDAVSVASDFKVFFNGSKFINSGKKPSDASVAEIPSLHGRFRYVSRSLHSITRVELNSGFGAGSSKVLSTALEPLASTLSYLGENSVCRTELLVSTSISDEGFRSRLSEMLAAAKSLRPALSELYASSSAARLQKDYLLFVHKTCELLDLVRSIVSWEATAAFVSLGGSEVFADRIQGDNGSLSELTIGDNPKADKKSEKKKKVVLGKGTIALMQFIKGRLLQGAAKYDLEKCAQDFQSLLDPESPGFDDLVAKVKEIVETNESRRLPKLPKVQCCHIWGEICISISLVVSCSIIREA